MDASYGSSGDLGPELSLLPQWPMVEEMETFLDLEAADSILSLAAELLRRCSSRAEVGDLSSGEAARFWVSW